MIKMFVVWRDILQAYFLFRPFFTLNLIINLIRWLNNKKPIGHIALQRNQFKSMNTFEQNYDYTYILKLAQ